MSSWLSILGLDLLFTKITKFRVFNYTILGALEN